MHSSNQNTNVASSQKIVSNTIYSFISEISLLFTSIFYIVAANYLKDVAYVKFASALAFVGLFTLLVIFGFVYSITKFIVNNREYAGRYIGNALYIQFIFTIICFSFCYLIAYLFKSKYPLDVRYIIVIVFVAEALKCYNLTLRTAYKALNEFRYPTIAVLIERIFLLLVGSILLIGGYGLYVAALVLLASRLLGFMLLVSFSIRIRHRLFL
jgi:O-antigen/teichoic acid export membrane protein